MNAINWLTTCPCLSYRNNYHDCAEASQYCTQVHRIGVEGRHTGYQGYTLHSGHTRVTGVHGGHTGVTGVHGDYTGQQG